MTVHLRTITRDGWVCTAYLPGTVHDGTEGELYDLGEDPLQRTNRWDDPRRARRATTCSPTCGPASRRPAGPASPSTPPSEGAHA